MWICVRCWVVGKPGDLFPLRVQEIDLEVAVAVADKSNAPSASPARIRDRISWRSLSGCHHIRWSGWSRPILTGEEKDTKSERG
jgi:hypothetical protein